MSTALYSEMPLILTSSNKEKSGGGGGGEETFYSMAPKFSAIVMTFSWKIFRTLRLIPNFVGTLRTKNA